MNRSLISACALSICLAACVENEEEITVRADGSASVRLSAKGKAKDLSDGYGLPLAAPWTATDPETLEWIRLVGADTGSAAVRESVRGAKPGPIDPDHEMKLEVQSSFAAVQDWPRWFAPESEVYRTAYLERSATLKVQSKKGRRVYTFERVFHAREFERLDVLAQLKAHLSEELWHRLEKEHELTAEDRVQMAREAVAAVCRTSAAFASDALGSVYVAGDASLPAAKAKRIEESVQAEIARVASQERLTAVIDFEIPIGGSGHEGDAAHRGHDDARSAKQLEADVRSTLRSALAAALAREGVSSAMQNAIRGELEWSLTAYDHTCDLADESFEITVHMPGVVVGGNADEVSGGAAKWSFDGKDLQDRERTLRVVSLVE